MNTISISSHRPTSPAADRSQALAFTRRALVQSFCWRYRPYLVDHAMTLVGDERAAAAVVERSFTAMTAGRFPVPTTNTCGRLRAIVAELAVEGAKGGP